MNLYDVLAGQGTTHFERLFSRRFAGGGKKQTLTGQPPLSFKADGTPLISWSMKGNGQQQGTPTPDAPIQPTFCGVRTGNLAKYWKAAYVTASGTVNANRVNGVSFPVKIEAGQTVCFTNQKTNFGRGIAVFSGFDGETLTDMVYRSTNSTVTYTADSDCYVIIWCNYDNTTSMDESVFALCAQMLNLGSTALPYEPYGYKIPITCAGQTTPVYLGQTQTVRRIRKLVLTGEEEWLKSTRFAGSFYSAIIDNPGAETNPNIYDAICSHAIHAKTFDIDNYTFGKFGFDRDRSPYYLNLFIGESNWTQSDFKSYLAAKYAAGTPVTVWYVLAEPETGIVNEPLCKIGDYADELHSEDAGVTIPTARGSNTLTVGTELQPSSMTITFK